MEENEPPPLFSEVDKAVKELKNNKSPDCDEIVAELVKRGGEKVTGFFHKLCTSIGISKQWPDD